MSNLRTSPSRLRRALLASGKHGMMLPIALTALSMMGATAMAAPAAGATTAPIAYHAPSADELKAISAVYGPSLVANKALSLGVAQVDLQGAGTPSLVIRFNGAQTCVDTERCQTTVLYWTSGHWSQVFSHSARSITLAAPATLPGSAHMDSLVLDNGLRWIWTGDDHYQPDLSSIGELLPPSTNADGDVAAAARTAMMASADIKPELVLPIQSFRQTRLSLGTGAVSYLVSAYSPGMCSNILGCPQVLMVRASSGYAPLWVGFAPGPGAMLSSSNKGYHDLALNTYQGFEVLRFDGSSYSVVQTSYPSPVTPAP